MALCRCSGRVLLQDIPIDADDLKRTAVRVLAKRRAEGVCLCCYSLSFVGFSHSVWHGGFCR